MLQVQALLQILTKNMSLEDSLDLLYNKFSIQAKIYKDDCIVLNYSQLDIDHKFLPIVKECRGLILSYDLSSVYCKSFTRFYNYDEDPNGQKNFSFEDSISFEKVDGTLVNVWYHPVKKKWIFSTRKMAYAEGPTEGAASKSFYDAILKVFNTDDEHIQDYLNSLFYRKTNKDYTWIFEFVSPETKIITNYGNEYKLYYLGSYNNKTCKENFSEMNYKYFGNCFIKNITVPRIYRFNNLNDVNTIRDYIIHNLKDDEEGFVVFDKSSFNRVKVKNTTYLQLARVKGNGKFSPKRIIEYIVSGNTDIIQKFPDYYELINPYTVKFNRLLSDIQNEFSKYKDIETQKDFALAIKDNKYKSILFQLRNGKSIDDIIKNVRIDKIMEYIDEICID